MCIDFNFSATKEGRCLSIIWNFKKLFSKKKGKKPNAVAFVDYEHWYISLEKRYNMKPNIKSWTSNINLKYNIKEISFFADFSNVSFENEMTKIREFSSNIIQTKNAGAYYKKDFTDFIMLDHIYQRAMSAEDVDTFIIFSGDGHFSSVVSFLKNYCKKEVGVYGVKDAFSNQLKNTASWFEEVPVQEDIYATYYNMILSNLRHLESKKYRIMKPTFWKTVEVVSGYNNVDSEVIKQALQQLLDKGYISRKEEKQGFNRKFMYLSTNWDKLLKDGIWQPDDIRKEKVLLQKT